MSDPEADNLQRLRDLLLVEDREQISDLQSRLDDPDRRSREVAEVLSKAIVTRHAEATDLAEALEPQIGESLARSIREDPERIAEVIFPIIGPAIRRSIQQALSGLMQRLNQTLEHSFTLAGLKMRFEAVRTGVPFAEVVLRRSLVYRIEQLFLIHRETSLLLAQAVDHDVATKDPDMVSGMLTVVRDFVRDSLEVGEGDALDSMKVGELSIWVEPGSKAILAAVIRGTPPEDVRVDLSELLAKLHVEYASALADFDGDLAPFDTAPHHMALALSSQQKPRGRRLNPVTVVLVLILFGLIAWWAGSRMLDAWRMDDLVESLGASPGIEAVQARRVDGAYLVSGLRDPLAADPAALLEESGMDPERVRFRWEPFLATAPEFVVRRITNAMALPPGIDLEAGANGAIIVTGWSTSSGIDSLRHALALTAPGTTLDLEGWRSVTEATAGAVERIEEASIAFAIEAVVLTAEGRSTVTRVATAFSSVHDTDPSAFLVIRGHVDETGPTALNESLRDSRVALVRDALVAAGVPSQSVGIQLLSADDPRPLGRRVTFDLIRGGDGR